MPQLSQIVAENIGRHRRQQRLSMAQVARAAGISKATLLSIELGRANPTLETLERIGQVLNAPLADLVSPSATAEVEVQRAEDSKRYPLGGLQIRPLGTFYDPELVYVFTATVSAEGAVSEAHETGSVEGLLVLSGSVLAGPVGGLVELHAGDWLRYSSSSSHACRAQGGQEAEVLFVAAREHVPDVPGTAGRRDVADRDPALPERPSRA